MSNNHYYHISGKLFINIVKLLAATVPGSDPGQVVHTPAQTPLKLRTVRRCINVINLIFKI